MKQVISHKTRNLMIGGIINQDQLKIGTTGGSVVGIFFDNGKENLPGIRFHKQQAQTILTSTANNGTIDYYMVDPSATGFDRQWVSGPDNNGHTWRVASYRSGGSHIWVIYRDQNTGDSFQIFGMSASDVTVDDPWNESSWYEIEGNNTLTTLIQLKETIPATQEWEVSTDGIIWKPFASKDSIPYEVIDITSTKLTNGVATIIHNLGVKYPLGLGFTVVPDGIEYTDTNTLRLNYGSHALANFQAKVWFYNSKQSMLTGGASSNEA